MEHKIATLSHVKVLDEGRGIVEAYTNTMGSIDLDNDIIEPAAFDSSIQRNLPIPALVGHDANAVVGKVIAARSIPIGDGTSRLYTRIQFNLDTEAGRDSFSNVKGGFVREWSVGFNLPAGAATMEREGVNTIRRIADLDWIEVSSVLRGASPGTATIAAKATTPSTTEADDVAVELLRARMANTRSLLSALNSDYER
jgi:HK97 family phage prohead protease